MLKYLLLVLIILFSSSSGGCISYTVLDKHSPTIHKPYYEVDVCWSNGRHEEWQVDRFHYDYSFQVGRTYYLCKPYIKNQLD